MERKINNLSICYTLFLILLFLCESLSGVMSEIVYCLAFVLPLAVGAFLSWEDKADAKDFLTIKGKDVSLALVFVAPTVAVIMIISSLASFVIGVVTGAENSIDVGNALIPALISHALMPAILEEALFRYLPMRLLKGCSNRTVVAVSAIFFSLAHHSLFSIPYAIVAGALFMMLDIAADSVIPSVLLHFVNNAISVSLLVYGKNPAFVPTVLAIIAVASVFSAIVIYKKREEYLPKIKRSLSGGEKIRFTLPMVLFIIVTLSVAILSLN